MPARPWGTSTMLLGTCSITQVQTPDSTVRQPDMLLMTPSACAWPGALVQVLHIQASL